MWDRVVKRLFSAVLKAYRRRAMLCELEGLDDRMLKDIGLSRSELPAAVEHCLAGIAYPRARAFASTLSAGGQQMPGRNDNRSDVRPAA